MRASLFSAYKSNATVALNTRDYKDKMQKLLDDPTYKSITTDPTTYLEKTIRTRINNTPLSEETKQSIIPRENRIGPRQGQKYKPELWLRYVDDSFIIWRHYEDKLQDFLSHLNSIHPKTKFTVEIENQITISRRFNSQETGWHQRLTDADHIRTGSSEIKHILRTNSFTTYTINRGFLKRREPMNYVTKAYLAYGNTKSKPPTEKFD
ncbi:hypothetical protein Trydic_g7806 [Trypoxylus dichotomus]